MSLLSRILSPVCGHGAELALLRQQLAEAERQALAAVGQSISLESQVTVLEAGKRTLRMDVQDARSEMFETARAFEAFRELAGIDAARLREQISETAAALEEATTLNSTLAAQHRELNSTIEMLRHGGEQLPLIDDAPETEEPAVLAEEAGDELVSDSTAEEVWQVVGVYFLGGHHWSLKRDRDLVHVAITDKDWLKGVRSREVTFGAGDVLRLQMRTATYLAAANSNRPYTRRLVERVIEVIPPQRQDSILDEAEPLAIGKPVRRRRRVRIATAEGGQS